jgi:hypothetical protein
MFFCLNDLEHFLGPVETFLRGCPGPAEGQQAAHYSMSNRQTTGFVELHIIKQKGYTCIHALMNGLVARLLILWRQSTRSRIVSKPSLASNFSWRVRALQYFHVTLEPFHSVPDTRVKGDRILKHCFINSQINANSPVLCPSLPTTALSYRKPSKKQYGNVR